MAKTFPQPFIGPVCILMNSDVSYHAWCQGHLSSSLSTFVFDQPLALWRRLHHEGVGTKISPIQQIWEDPTIVKLNVLSWGSWYPFLNLGWMWSLDWNTYKYTKLDNIHAGIWIFKLGIHMSLLEVGQSSLTGWWVFCILNSNAIFGACLLWGVAQIAKDSLILLWATPIGKKICLLAQVLVTFYEDQIHIEALFSFISSRNLMGPHAPQSFSEVYKNHHAKQEVRWWCEVVA